MNVTWRTSLGAPNLSPAGHPLLLVQVPGCTTPHAVDINFGGTGAFSMLSRPIPLWPGTVVPSLTPPEEYRLICAPLPESSLSSPAAQPEGWFLQARAAPEEAWRSVYHFTTAEYTMRDLEYINYSLSHIPSGPVTYLLLCIKVRALPSGELERISISSNRAVRKVGSKREVVETFRWEDERVDAMRRLCGITLEADALENVKGRKVALLVRS